MKKKIILITIIINSFHKKKNEKDINIDINKKFILEDLTNKKLNDLLEYYSDKKCNNINYADIYYYLYFYNETNGKFGKYSNHFYEIY